MRFFLWIGQSGVMAMMVEQLGLAIMPLWLARASGLISGMTRGTPGSIRNAEELSTTTAPARAAMGANFLEMEPPALKKAISTPWKLFSVSTWTVTFLPLNVIFFPRERADASRRRSDIGKRRSWRQRRNSAPTAPVAPTIATTYFFLFIRRLF